MVRSAVAISESVFLMPHLANTEVSPEKKADTTAMESQSISIHAPPQLPIVQQLKWHIPYRRLFGKHFDS